MAELETPAMKVLAFLLFASGIAVQAQPVAPPASLANVPDDAVVAVFDDGTPLTALEFKTIYQVMPTQNQQAAAHNLQSFIEQYALMRKLAQLAEKQKLDQQSPNKEALEYYRLFLLSQAMMNNVVNTSSVQPPEVEKYYDAHKDEYKQVKVKAIYISYSSAQASQIREGKRVLTKEEAKAKADDLVKQIRAGADFLKLVAANSDDATSREKNGDFATLQATDKIPDAIRTAVFALKQGEITDAVEQPNGFYILRADEIQYRPIADVSQEITETLRQEHFRQWMDQTRDAAKVKFPHPEYLKDAPAGPAK